MFFFQNSASHILLSSSAMLLATYLLVPPSAQAQTDASATADQGESSTIIYDQAFIQQYTNAVTIIDIIRRIPGGQQILDSGGGQSSRGFSGNDDRILIDGKRLSGKSNDSESALSRITVDQVERIELIRGSSPDVKTSSQQAIINIVLKEGAGGGSGSWRAKARLTVPDGRVGFGGFLSYGGAVGPLEYFLSAEADPDQDANTQIEQEFSANGVLRRRLEESGTKNQTDYELTANLIYNLGNGDQIRLNGLYSDKRSFKDSQPGIIFEPIGPMDQLIQTGRSFRFRQGDNMEWEIGGDYETALSDTLQLKILGLHSDSENINRREEDFDITGAEPEVDFRSIVETLSTESIGRTSLVWNASAAHEFEFGTEFSLNKRDVRLQFFDRVGDLLIPRDLSASDVTVKETRNESFLIDTWKLNDKMSLETSFFTEYSRISQNGVGVSRSRTFFFVRPSTDFRYNISSSDQLQISVRRLISQLNFSDFASSVSRDDEIIAGNENLAPSKSWQFETSFEHRFANDDGSIKLRALNEQISGVIQRIEIAPGISGVGNSGNGRITEFELEGNFRLTALGMPDFVVETSVEFQNTRVTDPFTGERRPLNFRGRRGTNIGFRNDVNSLGLSFGGDYFREWKFFFHDIDERTTFAHPRQFLTFFIEKKLIWGAILRVDANNLLNTDFGRDRLRFDGGIATGILTSREIRSRKGGRRIEFTLRGTF